MSKEDGEGMYGGMSIWEIKCVHVDRVVAEYGSVICDCADFPDRCKECKKNKSDGKYIPPFISPINIKSYFKPRR